MMRHRNVRRRLLVAPLVVGLAYGLAACTSGTNSSGGSTGAIVAPSASENAGVASAAKAAAAKAGSPTAAPKLKVSMVRFIAQDESDQRLYGSFEKAAKVMGWTVDACDGQGDPTQMLKCMNSVVAAKPDAIVVDAIPQTIVASGLQAAKAAGIPVVTFGGPVVPGDLYSANYAPPDADMATLLAQYVTKQLDSTGTKPQMIVQTANLIGAGNTARVGALDTALQGTDIDVVSRVDVDTTNTVAGTQSQMSALLTQYPDTKAIWVTFDSASAGAAQAVAAKFPGKSFPDAPAVVTFYDSPQTLDLIRQGKITASVAEPLEWTGWVAVDQLAELFARKTPLSQDERPDYGSGMTFWTPSIVTKDNLPAEGQIVPATVNFEQFFTTKWKDEFGVS